MDTKARPGHRRNASSKSAMLRSWVSSSNKSRPASPDNTTTGKTTTYHVPLLPADAPPGSSRGVLGERANNVQSPPQSPSKKEIMSKKKSPAKKSKESKEKDKEAPMKSKKSSSNLAAVFAKINRSSKDVSKIVATEKDKENTTPPVSSASGLPPTPIWAQFASAAASNTFVPRSDSIESRRSSIHEEIARYTPQNYSPGKQRNFNGTLDQPGLRPTLNSFRPQSAYFTGSEGIIGAIGRRVSGGRQSMEGRRSEESSRRQMDQSNRASLERAAILQRNLTDRKTSAGSAEQPVKEKLNIVKRGGRVMAAVAAFQGKKQEVPPPKEKDEAPLDPKAVDAAFEAVLDSRNIPEPMRQKMRTLTLRVKADFIKQDSEASKTAAESTVGTLDDAPSGIYAMPSSDEAHVATKQPEEEVDSNSTKRSRPRSRTFTFTRGEKKDKGDASPTKKHRSRSKSRPTSIHIPKEPQVKGPTTPSTPTGSMGRKSAPPANPSDYISYLRSNEDPTTIEVGRLHKLRILLRNETVAWVDNFISQQGMAEIIGLLNRIMVIEWREEHEDQLLHETLLCLKGLCTTERAMAELDQVADTLFPALLGMLFDDEKKGPAEYTTRTIVINVLFTFLATATNTSSQALETRARRILAYLGERPEPEDARPVDFVLTMRTSRPYKLWCRELSNVTKEVFWIFLHHLNVVPHPKPTSSHLQNDGPDRAIMLEKTYTERHFPGARPPVPAAPYIGGVEWDATTYITAHLDLLNGLVAALPDDPARNALRKELQMSGFEKVMGGVLRTCKEKFYQGVHDGLRAWVAAAQEDGWQTRFVREGPSHEEMAEQAMRARSASPRKKRGDEAPKLDAPRLEAPKLDLGFEMSGKGDDGDDGWLG